jgi:hypothetical protein
MEIGADSIITFHWEEKAKEINVESGCKPTALGGI